MVSSSTPAIYVSSRASIPERVQMWRDLRSDGVNIVSSWIDDVGGDVDFVDLWNRVAREIASADAFIIYAEAEDFPLRDALIEIGIALALGKPVHAALPGVAPEAVGSWLKHPTVRVWQELADARRAAERAHSPAAMEAGNGSVA